MEYLEKIVKKYHREFKREEAQWYSDEHRHRAERLYVKWRLNRLHNNYVCQEWDIYRPVYTSEC